MSKSDFCKEDGQCEKGKKHLSETERDGGWKGKQVKQKKSICKKVDTPPYINSDDILEILARRVLKTIIDEMKQENE